MLTVAFLCEEKIRLPRGGEIGHSIARVEERRSLILWELCVWAEGQGFVVSETAVCLVSSHKTQVAMMKKDIYLSS